VADAERLIREPRRLGNPFQGPRGGHVGGSSSSTHGLDGPGECPWAVEPDVGRVAHGVSNRVHRLRCLGNAVVPQVAEHVGRIIMESVGV
jgi:DNA (cytosine-5)-methyltransferase 1